MKLSKNFDLKEFTESATAVKEGIQNVPDTEQIANLQRLVENVLQPARDAIYTPIVVTSGFRSAALNKAIGGASSSQHLKGEAADIICVDNVKLFNYIRSQLEFDQLIWEHGSESYPDWVHVSLKAQGNRKEVLRAVKEKGGIRYLKL